MIINKIDIIIEAFQKLRISGLTVDPTPEDVVAALRRMTGVFASLPWNVGYIYPGSIGADDPNDDSGITVDLFDPLSSILAGAIAGDFGKQFNPIEVNDAKKVLARKLADVAGSNYPTTLPTGTANEYCGSRGDYFYDGSQPSENTTVELP